jgi:hypothetical protein
MTTGSCVERNDRRTHSKQQQPVVMGPGSALAARSACALPARLSGTTAEVFPDFSGQRCTRHDIASRGADASGLCFIRVPLELRGRREGRASTETRGPRAIKKHGEGTTGSAKDPAFPAQWLCGLFRALPRNRAFLLLSPRGSQPRDLTSASGGQDHTTSPHVSAPFVRTKPCASPLRPSQPALNVRDDASVPLRSRRVDSDGNTFFRKTEAKYFSLALWTGG